MNKNLLSLIIFLSLSMVTSDALADRMQRVNWTAWGSILLNVAQVDPQDPFMLAGGANIFELKFSGPPGRATVRGINRSIPSIENPPDLCNQGELLLTPFENSMVVTFAARSTLLFGELDPDETSFICIDLVTAEGRANAWVRWTGGTGRFAGVTGGKVQINLVTAPVTFVGDFPSTLSWETGTVIGTVEFNDDADDDDDDDDDDD